MTPRTRIWWTMPLVWDGPFDAKATKVQWHLVHGGAACHRDLGANGPTVAGPEVHWLSEAKSLAPCARAPTLCTRCHTSRLMLAGPGLFAG
jgi:hypothetical protein